MKTRRFVAGLALAVGCVAATCIVPAWASDHTAAVWAREDEYWRDVRTGAAEHYETLWHDRFIGWPCDQEHPLRKAAIGDWVRKIRDGHIAVAVELTHEGAQEFDDVVVVHYSFTRVDTYPDGQVKGRGERRKITHTWMKAGDTWKIVGGMCGELAPLPSP